MQRRLPVFFLVDTSESMAGSPMSAVTHGFKSLISAMQADPRCIESVHVSVITFGGTARVLLPLTPVEEVSSLRFTFGCGTSLGEGLDLLLNAFRSDLRSSAAHGRGDWRPLCFLLSDGSPTDAWQEPARKIRALHDAGRCFMAALACGPDAEVDTLRAITPIVHQSDVDPTSLAEYFKWVTKSMRVASITTGDLPIFASPALVAPSESAPARRPGLFLITRCQKTRLHCLMKYRWAQGLYQATESVAIEELETSKMSGQEINTSILGPCLPCPRCEAAGWAMCGVCNRLFCHSHGVKDCVCPWCAAPGFIEVRDFGLTGSGG